MIQFFAEYKPCSLNKISLFISRINTILSKFDPFYKTLHIIRIILFHVTLNDTCLRDFWWLKFFWYKFNIFIISLIGWCGRIGEATALDAEGVGLKSQRSTTIFKTILNISRLHYLKCASNIIASPAPGGFRAC